MGIHFFLLGGCGCSVDSDGLAHFQKWSVDESCRLLLAEAFLSLSLSLSLSPPLSLSLSLLPNSFPLFLYLSLETFPFPVDFTLFLTVVATSYRALSPCVALGLGFSLPAVVAVQQAGI